MIPLLEVKDLCFAYPNGHEVFKNLSFKIFPQEKVCIVGKNGAGKTTFFHVIMGLLRPIKGEIILDGKVIWTKDDLRYLRKKVGFLFQDPEDQLFCPTLLEDVLFGPLNMGFSRVDALDKAHQVLNMLDIEDLAHKPPYTLSGGQKRLGALASVLVMDPELLLLDEPSSGLDEEAWQNLVQLLQNLNKAIIIASHDTSFLERITSNWYELSGGKLNPLENRYNETR